MFNRLSTRLMGWLLAALLRLWRRTWRLHVEGRDRIDGLYARKKQFILCFWHGKYVPILPVFEGYDASVLTSVSKRGNIIARICRNLGYGYLQIPDHGGDRSLRKMERSLFGTAAVGIAVDGPLGPRHTVKQGVVRLASETGFQLLPVSVDSRRKIVQKSRWDLMEIPHFFTTVCLVIGEPLTVPFPLSPAETGKWSTRLAVELESLDARAAHLVRKQG